jgi:hypothetical protein
MRYFLYCILRYILYRQPIRSKPVASAPVDGRTKMQQFRKKPVVIEATQLSMDNHQDVATWIAGAGYTVRHWSKPPMRAVSGLIIETLEGNMEAAYGDWIIKGVKGEFYPCKPDIFEATYDPA